MTLSYKHTKLACYLGYVVGAIINNLTPILFIIFQDEFGIKMWQLSLLITLNFGTQMIVDFLGANFADKLGYRTIAVSANAFCILGFFLLGTLPFVMNTFAGLIISVIACAISSGLLEVIVSPIIAAIPSEESSGSMSLLHSFYCWGQVLVVVLTTLFLEVFGRPFWHIACFLWTIVPVLSGLLFTRVPINSFTNEENNIPMLKLFTKKIFWVFLVLMLCSGASELAMAQWASLFAETALGVPKTVGDLLGPCSFAILMGISRVFYAKYAEKLNISNYLMFCSLLCVLSYLLVALSPNSYLSLAGCALCGFSVGVMWPGVLSIASVKCAEGGTALFALLAFAGDVGCFTGPNFAAAVAEKFSIAGSALKGGLLSCAVFPLIMILFTLILKRMKDGKVNE